MKVSVIVPVYNTAMYIDDCLNSLVGQTLKEIEIIVVNDGSTDNSQEIIDVYNRSYPNVKCYQKANSGLSDTRNFGLQYATGEYIAFVDSDDYVDKDMFLKMYEKAKSKNCDIVACDVNYIYPTKQFNVSCNIKEDTTDIKKAMINIYPAVCTKIFKRDLFYNKVFFKNGVWFEDVEFIHRILPYVKSIGVVHEALYQYIQRDKSITNTVSPKIYDYISNFNGVVAFYKERGLYDAYKKELEYAYVRYIYATFVKNCLPFPYEDYEKAVGEAIKNVQANFPKYRHNKYFYQSLKGIYLVLFNKLVAKILYKLRSKKK